MLSPSRLAGAALLGLALLLPLAGCTGLTPVYGERGPGTERLALRYGEPANRLEQLIYQDLALRLGRADAGGTAPKVTLAVSSGGRALSNDIVSAPNRPHQVTVRAFVVVMGADGTRLYSGTLSQSADYTTDAQALANAQAADAAAAQAAHLLADTIRLQLIAVLAR
jgi:hypothetical protein